MLVEVLFSHQSVAPDGNAVVCCEDDIGVVDNAIGGVAVAVRVFEFGEDTAELLIKPVHEGCIASDFVADDGGGAVFADAGDGLFIADVEVAVIEGMEGVVCCVSAVRFIDRKVTCRQWRCVVVEHDRSGRGAVHTKIFGGEVFAEEVGVGNFPDPSWVVWVRETEIHEKRSVA